MGVSLSGRVAVVTGGAGGIGSAICRRLAADGAAVVVTHRGADAAARELVDSLPGTGHLVVRAPVDDSDALTAMADQLADRFAAVDLLVNNAGVTRAVPHDDLDGLEDAVIDEIFRTNWRGAFATIRALRQRLEASDAATVVNLSSVAAVTGIGSNVAYCASKAAMDSMTRSLARALAPRIRVVSVSPGWVLGPYAERMPAGTVEAQAAATPLGRVATAEEVADAVWAVATTLTFTTGCVIPVDGGRPLGT